MKFIKRHLSALIVFSVLGFIGCWQTFFEHTPPAVQAQSYGLPFQVPFTVPAGTATTIPPCVPPAASPCIPNNNQVAHQITYSWSGGSSCSFTLDGSNDNVTWFSITSGQQLSLLTGTSYANGYFNFLRIKVKACMAGNLNAVYTGLPAAIPINPVSDDPRFAYFTAAAAVYYSPTPYMIQSFQCYNPNGSVAWLQLFQPDSNTATLGTNIAYEFVIPADSNFNYTGPWLPAVPATTTSYSLFAGASTTQSGSTAVSTAVFCQFELGSNGPFYPQLPVSP